MPDIFDSLPKSDDILSQMKGSPYSPTYLSCHVDRSKKTIKVFLKKLADIIASLVGASMNPPLPNTSDLQAPPTKGGPTTVA